MPDMHLEYLPVKEKWLTEFEACTVADKIEAVDFYPEIQESITRFVNKTGYVLEAGCGLGGWVSYLKRNGYQAVGIDYLEPIINTVKAQLTLVPLIVADVDNLPFKNNTFNSYLSFGVVEHIGDGPDRAIKEAFRITKPGGVILISVPYKHIIFWIGRFKGALRKISILRWLLGKRNVPERKYFFQHNYSRREFIKMLKKFDAEIVDHFPYGFFVTFYNCFGILRNDNNKWDYKLNAIGRSLCRFFQMKKSWFFGHMQMAIIKKGGAIRNSIM